MSDWLATAQVLNMLSEVTARRGRLLLKLRAMSDNEIAALLDSDSAEHPDLIRYEYDKRRAKP
jgi:hypothetical protein